MRISKRGLIVCKFGGSSIASEPNLQNIKQILASDPNRRIIVVSAHGKSSKHKTKVTDLLISAYIDRKNFHSYMYEIQKIFEELASRLEVSIDIKSEIRKIKRHFCLWRTRSYLLSRGEYLTAKIFAHYLNAKFVDSAKLIKFTSSGKILPCTYKKIQTKLQNFAKVIIPGFYGSNIFGRIMVMSRGGSDITGTIVAKGLGCNLYENWTDVSNLESDYENMAISTPISNISYTNMRFLSFFGASVLHYKASSLQYAGKTIIKNTLDSKATGTIISNKSTKLKFAHASKEALEIEIPNSSRVQSLLKKMKAEILYEQVVLGDLVVGFSIREGYSDLRIRDKLISLAKSVKSVKVHGYICNFNKIISILQDMKCVERFFVVGSDKFLVIEASTL